MELRQMEYFLAVSREKSFTKAAEKLYISQPAITSSINNIEGELGVKLFVRTKRFVALTPEGQTFYNYVSSLMQDVDNALAQMNQLREQNIHTIKAAINPITAAPFFLPALKLFLSENSNTFVSFDTCNNERIKYLFQNEGYQIGIVLGKKGEFPSSARILREGCLMAYQLSNTVPGKLNCPLLSADGNDSPGKELSEFLNGCESIIASHTFSGDVVKEILNSHTFNAILPDFFPCPEHRTKIAMEYKIEASVYILTLKNLPEPHKRFVQLLERSVK